MKHLRSYKPHLLVTQGPLVDVVLRPPKPVARLLVSSRRKVPEVPTIMMIDTGAARSVIENRLALKLGLNPIRYEPLYGFSHKEELCPIYRVTVELAVGDGTGTIQHVELFPEMVGVGAPESPLAHSGLIGRDLLQHFHFFYDGLDGHIEIIVLDNVQRALWPDREPITPAPAGHGHGAPRSDHAARLATGKSRSAGLGRQRRA